MLPGSSFLEITTYGRDKYFRTVGLIRNRESRINVNEEMIRNGDALMQEKYCKKSFSGNWKTLQRDAQEKKLGLWNDEKPVAPWEYRKIQRENRRTHEQF